MVQFKNRYMIFEILIETKDTSGTDSKKILSSNNVLKAVKDSIHLNFGECGLALSLGSLQLKYLNSTTRICIIRTSREDHQKVWCAITMVRNIGNYAATFNLLDLSGNIKSCKKIALKCEEARLEHYMLTDGKGTQDITNTKEEISARINSLDS